MTDSKNTDNVEKFRGALIDKVDSIYKYATELDYERLYAETEIIYTHPKVISLVVPITKETEELAKAHIISVLILLK